MSTKNMSLKVAMSAVLSFCMLLALTSDADAAIVTTNLNLYYRADNVNGLGATGTGSTTTLVNLVTGLYAPGTTNGTIVNGTGVTQNVANIGTAYEYGVVLNDSSPVYINANSFRMGGGAGINKVNSGTWEFWLKADSGASSNTGNLYVEFPAADPHNRHFVRLIGITTAVRTVNYDEFLPSGGGINSDSALYDTSTFTQIVVTKNVNTLTYYKNGVQFGVTKTNGETYSGAAITGTALGGQPTTNSGAFDGQFNVIRVYDGVLTAAEVLQNYNATLNNTTYTLDALNVADATVIVGGSTTFDSQITNTGAGFAANTLNYSGLSATVGGGGAISGGPGSGSGLATSATGTQSLTYDSTGSSFGLQTLTSALGTATNGDQAHATLSSSTTASVTVLDHSDAEFVSGSLDTLNLNFGSLAPNSGVFDLQYQIENLAAAFRAGLDLDSIFEASDPSGAFSTNATPFGNLAAGSPSSFFDVFFDTTGLALGPHTAQYTFSLSDQDLPGALGGQTLTLNVTAMVEATVVPEPSTFVLAALGLVSLGIVGWRQKRWGMENIKWVTVLQVAMSAMLSFCVLLALAGGADAATITTATGSGADSFIAQNETNLPVQDQNLGANVAFSARATTNSNDRSEIGYVKFDLNAYIPGTFTGTTTLTLTFASTITNPGAATSVYGLNNGAGDLWIEGNGGSDNNPAGELTYNNAPGITQDSNYGDSDINLAAAPLKGTVASFGTAGTTTSLASAGGATGLTTFLNADTNGFVTFIFERVTPSNSMVTQYATKEHDTLAPPSLTFTATLRPSTTFELDALNVVDSTIIVGGSTTFDGRITNTGTGDADTLSYTGLSATVTGGGSISGGPGSGGPLALSASGTQSLTFDSTGSSFGIQTLTPTVGTATNTNVGGAATEDGGSPITASVTVLDHSDAEFVSGSLDTLNLNFGSLAPNSGVFDLQYRIENLAAAFRAGLDLDSILEASDPSSAFSTNATPFGNLAAGSPSSFFDVFFDTTGLALGPHTAQYTFSLSDQDLPGALGGQTLTLNVTAMVEAAVVPEPSTFVLAALGLLSLGLFGWRRKKLRI